MALAAAALLLATAPPALAGHELQSSSRCVQAVGTPLQGGAIAGDVRLGARCRYRSTASGGYRATGDWRLLVWRADGTKVVRSSSLGSPSCAGAVIRPGDVVEIESTTAIAAGAGIGC